MRVSACDLCGVDPRLLAMPACKPLTSVEFADSRHVPRGHVGAAENNPIAGSGFSDTVTVERHYLKAPED